MTKIKPIIRQRPTQQYTVLLAADLKNSVLAEIDAGNPHRIAYSPYGQQSAEHEVVTRLGFNGELQERQLGWYLLGNGYRAYNPALLRFHSPDSLSPFGAGGLNAYVYCGGEPVMNKDSTGHTLYSALFVRFNSVKDNVLSLYQTQRASGLNQVRAISSAINGQLPNTLGMAALPAPTSRQFTAKNGWFHSNVGGVPSSTPDRGTNASLPGSSGGGSMWDRLAARTQSTTVAVVRPNYGPSRQVAVVRPNQPTPPPPVTPSSSSTTARNGAAVQPYRPPQTASSSSTWSGESGPSDWTTSSSNSSIRNGR